MELTELNVAPLHKNWYFNVDLFPGKRVPVYLSVSFGFSTNGSRPGTMVTRVILLQNSVKRIHISRGGFKTPNSTRIEESKNSVICKPQMHFQKLKYTTKRFSLCSKTYFFVSSYQPMRGNIGRSTGISNTVRTSSAGGAKDCSNPKFHAPA